NTQCESGLVCGTDNGDKFGMGATTDVCVPPHCTDGVLTGGTDETGVDCGLSGSDCGACAVECPDDSHNGEDGFCSTECRCSSGQGDCDAATECLSGLDCGTDNGDQFGMPGIDVCVPPHCTDGVLTGGTDETGVDCGASGSDCGACPACPDDSHNGEESFCTAQCPCESGQADCDVAADCESGLVCGTANGAQFGMPGTDACVPSHCTDGVKTTGTDETGVDCSPAGMDCGVCAGCMDDTLNGDASFCTATCKCGSGRGDCDGNTQCASGLVCGADNGPKFGMPATYDVCVPTHCTDGVLTGGTDETGVDCGAAGSDCGQCACLDDSHNGEADFCTTACPCSSGQGDCDLSAECESELICASDNGAKFGMTAQTDVCVPATCTNGVFDPEFGETTTDCGGPCGSICS
ncbi:MAG: hypothetical protein JW940_27155, partial [Polyangiaceae bacterium]|nr:hypothetical protein [Polyangiaceae bacterium]